MKLKKDTKYKQFLHSHHPVLLNIHQQDIEQFQPYTKIDSTKLYYFIILFNNNNVDLNYVNKLLKNI